MKKDKFYVILAFVLFVIGLTISLVSLYMYIYLFKLSF
jgi:hypothetical protein